LDVKKIVSPKLNVIVLGRDGLSEGVGKVRDPVRLRLYELHPASANVRSWSSVMVPESVNVKEESYKELTV
jgi:hypothetical protein